MSAISANDKKLLASIRRERELAGPRIRSTRINNKKGKGSYKRTTKHAGRYEA